MPPEARRLGELDVVVLVGGLGKRLRAAVADKPKPLAEVGGRPFLDLLLDYARGFGLRRFVLCAGYKAEQIAARYEGDPNLVVSAEPEPLGTAGALKLARPLIRGAEVLVLNGDSICRADLAKFWGFHRKNRGEASVVLAPPEPGADYGVVSVDRDGRVSSFAEKTGAGKGQLINAGIYLFSTAILDAIPSDRPSGLESGLLQSLAAEKRLWGFAVKERVVDIGTPERYEKARRALP